MQEAIAAVLLTLVAAVAAFFLEPWAAFMVFGSVAWLMFAWMELDQ